MMPRGFRDIFAIDLLFAICNLGPLVEDLPGLSATCGTTGFSCNLSAFVSYKY